MRSGMLIANKGDDMNALPMSVRNRIDPASSTT